MQDVEVHKKSVAWNTTPRLPHGLKGLQQVGVSLCQFTLQAELLLYIKQARLTTRPGGRLLYTTSRSTTSASASLIWTSPHTSRSTRYVCKLMLLG